MGAERPEAVYLNNSDILPWKRPLPADCASVLHRYNGSTILKSYFGLDVLDETINQFRVVASAAKYLADIARVPSDALFSGCFEEDKSIPKEVVLFSGTIEIYEEGMVPGTEFKGYDLKARGRIWTATANEEIYTSPSGLKALILGESKAVSRVEAIAKGFDIQEENAERARHQAQ